jgi:hypothetical protein
MAASGQARRAEQGTYIGRAFIYGLGAMGQKVAALAGCDPTKNWTRRLCGEIGGS